MPGGPDGEFVARMEDVLDVYEQPYDPKRPVVCLDETTKQLVAEARAGQRCAPGQPARQDYEYVRTGVCNLFVACEPLAGWRSLRVTQRRTKVDWAQFVKALLEGPYAQAEKVVLIEDNLNTHTLGALYEAFPPAEARRLARRLELHFTPKHGSWLNVAEIELSILARQCLNRRIADQATLERETEAWERERNSLPSTVDWQFRTADARLKLMRLYPSNHG